MKGSSGGESKIPIPSRCLSGRSAPVFSHSSTLPASLSMTSIPMVAVASFAEIWLGKPPIMAITLFLDRDVAKPSDNPRQAWEKLQRKPPIMAITLFSDLDRAKAGDNSPSLGKIQGKPPIIAIWLISDRDRAKASATFSGGLGKNSAEAAIDGDQAFLGPRSRQSQRDPQPIGKNS